MPFETSPIDISELIAFLDGLLDPGAFEDYGPNGLQVPGRETATKVVTGVSARWRPSSCSSITACSGTSCPPG